MSVALRYRLLQAALVAAPLAFGVAGCETMDKLNPFAEKQVPLPGARKALFPEGVPGVEFGAAPQQPTNSNIPITPSIVNEEQRPPQPEAEQTRQSQAQPQPARTTQPAKGQKSGGSGDAWSGTR